jgi:hypothetical protein
MVWKCILWEKSLTPKNVVGDGNFSSDGCAMGCSTISGELLVNWWTVKLSISGIRMVVMAQTSGSFSTEVFVIIFPHLVFNAPCTSC